MLSRFERHQAVSYGAAEVPSKTMCRQTLTTPDGPERHRRFYLAVLISRDLRPNSRPVMSGIVDSGPEGGLVNIDASAPKQTSREVRLCRICPMCDEPLGQPTPVDEKSTVVMISEIASIL